MQGPEAAADPGQETRLLSPCPLSSETEERGMKYGGGQPGVALADSLTPGYFLKPLQGFWESRKLGRGWGMTRPP